MAKTDFKTIDEYHATFSGEALARMKTIRKLVNKVAPEAQEAIKYRLLK